MKNNSEKSLSVPHLQNSTFLRRASIGQRFTLQACDIMRYYPEALQSVSLTLISAVSLISKNPAIGYVIVYPIKSQRLQ